MPILADLVTGEGKMLSSTGTTISMEDTTADIEKKIESAYSLPTRDPEGARENPSSSCSSLRVPGFRISDGRQPEKYGGNCTYECYDDLAADLESGDLHPVDAK